MSSPDFTGTERFELIRRLGEGGFGVVYEAFDHHRSSKVALKLLREGEGAALYRFKREFRALADVSHPNLVALDELLADGGSWFFTMELVRGVPVIAYVRPTNGLDDAGNPVGSPRGRLNEPRLRSSLAQIADALNSIHRLGIVHRDIKPSNVLVTATGRVVVLDFGLVAERPVDPSDGDTSIGEVGVVLGTPAYMAPEQVTSDLVTPAADWYSVGVVLYQALTGRLPFAGSSGDVLEAKQWHTPPRPTELAPDAPEDLSDLCMKLLHANPERRPSGEWIQRSLDAARPQPRSDAVGTQVPDILIGRESHLDALTEAFETSKRGETVVAFVSGLSGMGKTALIRHFLHDEREKDPGLLALTSRCYERETMPYKAIDPVVDALARFLKSLPDIEVARVLPRDTALLARVFPVLSQIREVQRTPPHSSGALDSFALRQRAAEALRDLLYSLAAFYPLSPLIVTIDDAQWGDADSASILQQVLRPPDAPPLLLIVAYRSEDATGVRLLGTLRQLIRDARGPEVRDIEVGPLSVMDARALAASATAGSPDAGARANAIAQESGGNAFFIHELAQHAATLGSSTTLGAVVLDRPARAARHGATLCHRRRAQRAAAHGPHRPHRRRARARGSRSAPGAARVETVAHAGWTGGTNLRGLPRSDTGSRHVGADGSGAPAMASTPGDRVGDVPARPPGDAGHTFSGCRRRSQDPSLRTGRRTECGGSAGVRPRRGLLPSAHRPGA